MISGRMFSEWLDAVFPDWYPLASAMLTGAFGVLALGILVLGFAPHSMFMWMPPIAAFCGASAGYRAKEKQNERTSQEGRSTAGALSRRVIGPLSGAGPAAAAVIIQSLVDSKIFNTATTPKLAVIILACAVLGAAGGGLLRSRYERLGTGQSG